MFHQLVGKLVKVRRNSAGQESSEQCMFVPMTPYINCGHNAFVLVVLFWQA